MHQRCPAPRRRAHDEDLAYFRGVVLAAVERHGGEGGEVRVVRPKDGGAAGAPEVVYEDAGDEGGAEFEEGGGF